MEQFPLALRDILLGSDRYSTDAKVVLLNYLDCAALEKIKDLLDHVLKMVEAYFLTEIIPDKAEP